MEAAIAYLETLTRNDFAEKPSFNVYPNPFGNEINIIGFHNPIDVKAELYNALGQKVLESNFSDQTTISTESLSAGMYFLKLIQNQNITTHKIIKK